MMLSRDVVKDLDNLKIETWVNDVLVQVGNTRDMEFSCGQVPFTPLPDAQPLLAVACLLSCAHTYRGHWRARHSLGSGTEGHWAGAGVALGMPSCALG